MIKERMKSYFPPVVNSIREFQATVDTEAPEFTELEKDITLLADDSYLSYMTEDRIVEWEKELNIAPLPNSTLEDRRDVIIARVRGKGKLNTELINTIVKTFTGGTAESWFQDSTIFVEISPPPGNKSFKFENVENELKRKIPAHLLFNVSRNYPTWGEINNSFLSWASMKATLPTWSDVFLYIKVKE